MHQYLFYIGDFPVRSYGLIISLSVFLATGVGYYLVKMRGKGEEIYVVDLGIYCALAGLLGARLWDVFFFDWHYYRYHLTEILNVWQGGMAIQGGIVFGVATGLVYAKRHKLDAVALADTLAPALVFGQGLGRAANLMNGDAFGAPTGGDFGIVYPEAALARSVYGDAPLWPAEIWESQLDFVIFALLIIFNAGGKSKRGQTFALYIMLYSAMRFMLEFLRGDYPAPLVGTLSGGQVGAVVFFVGGALFFLRATFVKNDECEC